LETMATPRLYLSAAIANAPINARLRDVLRPRFELVLPQDFAPKVSHDVLPRAIFDACIVEMESCAAAIVLLDALGIDCAMECGWLLARKKKVIGVAGSSIQFSRHWMVKGCLTHVMTLDAVVAKACAEDPILGTVPTELLPGWDALADAVGRVL
jgi:nucleoside 2-deoxyribosyltransferase